MKATRAPKFTRARAMSRSKETAEGPGPHQQHVDGRVRQVGVDMANTRSGIVRSRPIT